METSETKPLRAVPLQRLVLVLRITFEVVAMLVFTPLVVLLGGVFQTWDEWTEAIQEWKREWNDQNDQVHRLVPTSETKRKGDSQ